MPAARRHSKEGGKDADPAEPMVATAGADPCRMCSAEPDVTVFDTAEFRKAVEIVRSFSNEATPEAENRPWNETTNSVITGQALFHIMGDWMKGEWLAAGKEPGADFGCAVPGGKAVAVTSDAMGVLGGQPEGLEAAELDLVAAFVDPVVSAEANQKKSSTSPRADASTDFLDACNKVAMDALNVPNGQVPNPFNVIDADWNNAIWTAMFNFLVGQIANRRPRHCGPRARARRHLPLTLRS